jgi:hypothetical protein
MALTFQTIRFQMTPTCVCDGSKMKKRLKQMRRIHNKQLHALRSKCGRQSTTFNVISTKECDVMWREFDKTLAMIEKLQEAEKMNEEVDADAKLFWFEEEERMYDI